jgi:hypothetical protein
MRHGFVHIYLYNASNRYSLSSREHYIEEKYDHPALLFGPRTRFVFLTTLRHLLKFI